MSNDTNDINDINETDLESTEGTEERTPRNVVRLRRAQDLITSVLDAFAERTDADPLRDNLGSALEYLHEAEVQTAALPTKAPRKNPLAPGVSIRLTEEGRVNFAYLGATVETIGKLVSDSPGRNRWVVAFGDGTKTAISARMFEIVDAK